MDEEPAFLVVAPFRTHLDVVAYPTSRMIRANCGHLAWLSPQGEHMVAVAYTCCSDCAQEVLIDESAGHERRAVPGAIEALRALHGDEEADKARAFLRAHGIIEEEETDG